MLKFKCWFYEQAIEQGSDTEVYKILPDNLPVEIQKAYDYAHSLKKVSGNTRNWALPETLLFRHKNL